MSGWNPRPPSMVRNIWKVFMELMRQVNHPESPFSSMDRPTVTDLSSAVTRVLCLGSVSVTGCHVNNEMPRSRAGRKKRLIKAKGEQ